MWLVLSLLVGLVRGFGVGVEWVGWVLIVFMFWVVFEFCFY